LENWVRAFKAGKLERIGASHRPLTDVEIELARVKRELALVRMERDILLTRLFHEKHKNAAESVAVGR
jgi:transposase